MNVYGELTSAQLENLAADPTLATLRKGRLWFRTDLSSLKIDLGGSTDTLALLAATQTFSGKSFSDAVTMAQISSPTAPSSGFTKLYTKSDGTMYQLPNGGSENQVGSQMSAGTLYKQIATPGTPSSGFQYFYPKSDGNFYTKLPSGVELPVGTASSGNKNYLTTYRGNTGNGNFELGSATGWSLFTTTLTGVIPTGTISAGAASITTFAATAVQPLAGTYSLDAAASTAWTAGQGFISDGFSIDTEDLGKMMQVTGYFQLKIGAAACNFSGTSANTFAVYLWDSILSAWVQPAGAYSMVQNSGVGYLNATFQTGISSTQYRLAIICINAPGAPVDIYFDDFFVGPQRAPMGPAITDAKAFTPTLSAGFGSPTNVNCFYRQVGDCCEMWGTFQLGSVAASVARISLPSGLAVDTTKIDRTNGQVVGSVATTATSTAGIPTVATLFIAPAQTTNLSAGNAANGSNTGNLIELNVSSIFNTGAASAVSFYAKVPIAGWSSNCVMSSDTDTRVVAANMYLSGTQTGVNTNNSAVAISLGNAAYDSHGAFSSASHNYVVPVSGYYRIAGSVFVNATNVVNNVYCASFLVNGSEVARGSSINVPSAASFIAAGFTEQSLTAGQTVQLALYGGGNNSASTLTVGNGQLTTFLTVSRMSGPSVVAASEKVYLHYTGNGGTAITASVTNIDFTTKVSDSHGAWATNIFTAPRPGFYAIQGSLAISSSTNATYYAYVNGSKSFTFGPAGITTTQWSFGGSIYLNTGDTLSVRSDTSETLSNSAFLHWISIFSQG